jgi:hypothetical protein
MRSWAFGVSVILTGLLLVPSLAAAQAAGTVNLRSQAAGNTALPGVGQLVSGSDGTNLQYFRVGTGAPLNTDMGLVIRPAPVQGSGTMTAQDQTVSASIGGYGAVGVQLTGTWTATVLFEATVDGSVFQAAECWPSNTSTQVTSSTANGVWHCPAGGFTQFRVRANPYTSGTITATVRVTQAAAKVISSSSGGTSSSFGSAFPGTGTAAGFSDGTNMQGARVEDLDTTGSTYYGLVTNLVRRNAGTPVELIGQQTMANSIPVTIASNQSAIGVAASQTGTWTVQPGNTQNTTPWLVIPGGGTFSTTNQQAVTASAAALPSNAAKRVCVQGLVANALDVFIGVTGVTTATGYPLTPGSSWCGTVSNSNQIFVIASSTGSSVAFTVEN